MITEEIFSKAVGWLPRQDDLDRCNCPITGVGHEDCGWDEKRNLPNFMTGSARRVEAAAAAKKAEEEKTVMPVKHLFDVKNLYHLVFKRRVRDLPTAVWSSELTYQVPASSVFNALVEFGQERSSQYEFDIISIRKV